MDLVGMATELLGNQLGDADTGEMPGALTDLLSNDEGELNLADLVSKVTSGGGLAAVVGSWLGDGESSGISADSIMEIFGSDAVSSFADRIGVDLGDAAGGLSEVLPQIVDKFSEGGSIVDSLGGASGILDTAKSLFGSFGK